MTLFYAPQVAEKAFLPEDESAHCVRVLRLSTGDEIQVTDGMGNFYRCHITEPHPKHCGIEILETLPQVPNPNHWSIAMAPTKNMDRIEWLTEKLTEIGIEHLYFLNCRYSERKILKTERLVKIAISAMKQSQRATLPNISEMESFESFMKKEFVGQKFICHCHSEEEAGERTLLKHCCQRGLPATILIGPEGDFSVEEVLLAKSAGFIPISLGNMRLRTETAALVAGLSVQLINMDA